MTHQQIYDELKLLAEQLGLTVRIELGDFEGGLCTVNEQRVILINRRHLYGKRINVMARALHQAGLGDLFIKPAIREIIEEELALSGGGGEGAGSE